jgi:hypothetical protein
MAIRVAAPRINPAAQTMPSFIGRVSGRWLKPTPRPSMTDPIAPLKRPDCRGQADIL